MPKKNEKKKEEAIRICPRCGSAEINADLSDVMTIWSGSTKWICSNCNYSSPIFPEVLISEIENFRKEIKAGDKRYS